MLFVSFQKLLENEKLLLVLADLDRHSIYLDHVTAMDAVIQRGNVLKTLHCDKVGDDVLFAYDEAKRMLTICASARVSSTISSMISKVVVLMRYLARLKMLLYAFVFDETFRSLQGQGSAINLAPWYSQAGVSILKLSSVYGRDEVVLVDSNAQVQIFSLITQKFR